MSSAAALDLGGRGLKSLPSLPPEFDNVRQLNLSGNRLRELPARVWELIQLDSLDLGNNRFSELPAQIGALANLTLLDVSENRLSVLPPELRTCRVLEDLHLYGNQLTALFDPDVRFDHLAKLDVSKNLLQVLPELGRQCPNLRDLDLSGNRLESLPGRIADLRRLEVLNLSGNQLTSVEELAGMTQIKELYLDDNLLSGVPNAIAGFGGLKIISADGNPFGQLPGAFEGVSAAALRRDVKAAVEAHISGGSQPGKHYVAPATFLFDFFLAIGGFAGVLTVVDLYYKRIRAAGSAILRFPDGSTIELNNVTRKTAIELVRQHEDSLRNGKALLDLDTALSERPEKSELVVQAVSRLGYADLIPKAGGQPVIHFNNYNFIDRSQRSEVTMGDQIHIGSISGSNVNLKSSLQNVQQTIGAAAQVDASTKDQLNKLIQQLSQVLEQAPAEKKADAEAVADAAADLVNKSAKDNPNKKSIEISANGLLEAAKGVAGVVPIAINIVETVKRFIAGG